MRIGIDCRSILNPGYGESGGFGHYTYYLVKHLLNIDQKNEYVLFFDDRVIETKELERKNSLVRFFPFAKYGVYLPFAYSQMLIAAFLGREQLDVYHSPANVIPFQYSGKSVQTVHDLALFVHPEWYPQKWFSRDVLSRRILLPQSIRHASRVIAVSQHTKKDLEKILHVPPRKIDVIYEGFDENGPHASVKPLSFEELSVKHHIEQQYLFFVGTIEARKNLFPLIRAFVEVLSDKKFSSRARGVQLVLAGKQGYGFGEVMKEVERANKKFGMEVIKYLGYILHEEKISLLKHALCFISSSGYEGFGLPALEAMALGCPVLVSKTTSFPEVVGEAGMYFDPNNVSDIAKTIKQFMLLERRSAFVKKGLEQAKKFTWDETAQQTLLVYQKVVNQAPQKKRNNKRTSTRKK